MKTTKTITIDVNVWEKARNSYTSVSAKIESLLRASLDEPEDIKEDQDENRMKQLEEKISITKATLSEAQREHKELVKNAENRERSTKRFYGYD